MTVKNTVTGSIFETDNEVTIKGWLDNPDCFEDLGDLNTSIDGRQEIKNKIKESKKTPLLENLDSHEI